MKDALEKWIEYIYLAYVSFKEMVFGVYEIEWSQIERRSQ